MLPAVQGDVQHLFHSVAIVPAVQGDTQLLFNLILVVSAVQGGSQREAGARMPGVRRNAGV